MAAFGLCGAGSGAVAVLSVEVRFGRSKLWRGLVVGVGFVEDPSPFAAFAATALASLSWSRSFCLALTDSGVDGPTGSGKTCQHAQSHTTLQEGYNHVYMHTRGFGLL